MTGCAHEIWEQNAAIAGDGLCPLCLRDEIERLRALLKDGTEFFADEDGDNLDEWRQRVRLALGADEQSAETEGK